MLKLTVIDTGGTISAPNLPGYPHHPPRNVHPPRQHRPVREALHSFLNRREARVLYNGLRPVDSKLVRLRYLAHLRQTINASPDENILLVTGTDDMVRIACALQRMQLNGEIRETKRIVIMGSMLPLAHPYSEGMENLGFVLNLFKNGGLKRGVKIVLGAPAGTIDSPQLLKPLKPKLYETPQNLKKRHVRGMAHRSHLRPKRPIAGKKIVQAALAA